jgi:hypothetical protein
MKYLDGYIKTTGIPSSCAGCVFINNGCSDQCQCQDYIFIEAPMKTPEIHETSHRHHAVWREYTESLLAGKPKQVEYRASVLDFWVSADSTNTSWDADFAYRIKSEPKLFWYMNGKKIVEKGLDSDVEFSVNIRSFNKDYSKQFSTQLESDMIAQELIRILNTLEVK